MFIIVAIVTGGQLMTKHCHSYRDNKLSIYIWRSTHSRGFTDNDLPLEPTPSFCTLITHWNSLPNSFVLFLMTRHFKVPVHNEKFTRNTFKTYVQLEQETKTKTQHVLTQIIEKHVAFYLSVWLYDGLKLIRLRQGLTL